MYVCIRSQEGASDHPELELQAVAGHHVVLEAEPRTSARIASTFNRRAISLVSSLNGPNDTAYPAALGASAAFAKWMELPRQD